MLIRLIILMCLFGFTASVNALPKGFYSASVVVSSQSARERSRAAKMGLKEVLVRASGSVDVVQSQRIQRIMPKASKYLQQYHYQLNKLESGEQEEQLVMVFSPAHIRRILSDALEPMWPTNRPKVLLWLVQDLGDAGKEFINHIESPVTLGLQQGAVARGLPITFPLMDLDDQLALSAQQVWSLDEEAILQASERYQVDTILVGRYTQTTQGQWRGTWQYFHRGQNHIYDFRTETGEALGERAIEPVADNLAELYSVTPNTQLGSELYIEVSRVDDFKSYKGALHYLERLDVVSSFNVVSVKAGRLVIGLQLAGNLSQLDSAVSLDDKMLPNLSPMTTDVSWKSTAEGALSQPLRFIWAGE